MYPQGRQHRAAAQTCSHPSGFDFQTPAVPRLPLGRPRGTCDGYMKGLPESLPPAKTPYLTFRKSMAARCYDHLRRGPHIHLLVYIQQHTWAEACWSQSLGLFWPVKLIPLDKRKIPKELRGNRSTQHPLPSQGLVLSFPFVSGSLLRSLPSSSRIDKAFPVPLGLSFDFPVLHPGPSCQNWPLIGSSSGEWWVRKEGEGWNNISN